MPIYHAPIDDMLFLMRDVFEVEKHILSLPQFSDVSFDLLETVLQEAGKLSENTLFPLNQTGDQEGCQYENGNVKTPSGFKVAYETMVEGGWLSLVNPQDQGGQGLPYIANIFLQEMLCAANVSFSLYVELTQGCFHFLSAYGSDDIKKQYLPKLNTGEWSGVMCLTEPHCGTDLSLIKTKAEADSDNQYRISGTKIFITGGEHDLSENIIHIVLARLPNAPEGVKGISVFLVPKYLTDENGKILEKNTVFCQGIEHKMGLKGSSTCTMQYDNAIGFLIGEPHDGLRCMFTMMNRERLSIGMEGLGLASVSYQNALQYAKDRLQGRALTGAINKTNIADPIINHPDVRHMLLLMKTFIEGARALACWLAIHIDLQDHDPESNAIIELLTPVVKAFFTDYGFQACNQGIQILGGHGYIAEWGMEQYARDARVSLIYEGTNGVQAMDLVKRKLIPNQGDYVSVFLTIIAEFQAQNTKQLKDLALFEPLKTVYDNVKLSTDFILKNSEIDPNTVGSSATAYLHLLGLCAFAFMWAKIAISANKLEGKSDKIKSAQYFMQSVLPKARLHTDVILSGSTTVMAFTDDEF